MLPETPADVPVSIILSTESDCDNQSTISSDLKGRTDSIIRCARPREAGANKSPSLRLISDSHSESCIIGYSNTDSREDIFDDEFIFESRDRSGGGSRTLSPSPSSSSKTSNASSSDKHSGNGSGTNRKGFRLFPYRLSNVNSSSSSTSSSTSSKNSFHNRMIEAKRIHKERYLANKQAARTGRPIPAVRTKSNATNASSTSTRRSTETNKNTHSNSKRPKSSGLMFRPPLYPTLRRGRKQQQPKSQKSESIAVIPSTERDDTATTDSNNSDNDTIRDPTPDLDHLPTKILFDAYMKERKVDLQQHEDNETVGTSVSEVFSMNSRLNGSSTASTTRWREDAFCGVSMLWGTFFGDNTCCHITQYTPRSADSRLPMPTNKALTSVLEDYGSSTISYKVNDRVGTGTYGGNDDGRDQTHDGDEIVPEDEDINEAGSKGSF